MQVETDTMLLFWQSDSVFSNWYQPVLIKYKDLEFTNSEALFMYMKAEFFEDSIAMTAIHKNQNPKTVKNEGRKVKEYNDIIWTKHRQSFMYRVNMLKFIQDTNLKDILISTGDKQLVEASPFDNIWGIGLRPDDPRALDESNWYGQNLLGRVLMLVRQDIKANRYLPY